MRIIPYEEKCKQQVIDLILSIQNGEYQANVSLAEQPDLLDVPAHYMRGGGAFWLAAEGDTVVGTVAFMNFGNGNALLKKFFVRANRRGQGIGLALYQTALNRLRADGYRLVLLDTPAVAKESHRFYTRAGFVRIDKQHPPFRYEYPDRDSYMYLLKLREGADISAN